MPRAIIVLKPQWTPWNDGDRHHPPSHIMITGVMRGYARHSRPQDVERLPVLMIFLIAISRCFVRNATEIDKYSRTHDGPNAKRVLGMTSRREGRGITMGGAVVIAPTSWHTQCRHKALGRGNDASFLLPGGGMTACHRFRSSAPDARLDSGWLISWWKSSGEDEECGEDGAVVDYGDDGR